MKTTSIASSAIHSEMKNGYDLTSKIATGLVLKFKSQISDKLFIEKNMKIHYRKVISSHFDESFRIYRNVLNNIPFSVLENAYNKGFFSRVNTGLYDRNNF